MTPVLGFVVVHVHLCLFHVHSRASQPVQFNWLPYARERSEKKSLFSWKRVAPCGLAGAYADAWGVALGITSATTILLLGVGILCTFQGGPILRGELPSLDSHFLL